MSETLRNGRIPFERIRMFQDFCSRTWSDLSTGCYAGLTNRIPSSSDLSDATHWEPVDYSYSASAVPDPDGGSDAILITKDADTGKRFITSKQDVPVSAEGADFVYSFSIRGDAGSAIDAVFFYVQRPGGSFASIRFTTAGGAFGDLNSAAFTDFYTVDQGDGWWRCVAIISTDEIAVPSLVRFYPADGLTLPAPGDTLLLYGPMLNQDVDQPYVATSGESIVASSDSPCFNTRASCQVPDVYDKTDLELQFCKPQQDLLKGQYIRPFVSSIDITPGKINPGGAMRSSSAVGERSSLSVSFQDQADADRLVDKYTALRDYDPVDRSTFWAKWRARNPYYIHRRIVYESGYIVDGQIVDAISRSFFITGFSGPDAKGRVTISAKDVLTFLSNDKAKAPFASKGKLSADIGAGAGSLTLTPAGIGNAEYAASGHVRVGKEVMAFTRSGDTLTLTQRAAYGTEAKEHDEGDTVQQCLEYVSQEPQEILYDLLLNYAGIPVEFLDKAQWDAEVLEYLPRLYSTIITEPEGVEKLVGEMCQQMYFTTWFDERESKVRMRAVRPAQDDPVYALDDSLNLVADSISWRDRADELITQVWVYYGQLNPTERLDQGDNYAALDVIASPDSEGEDRNNISRIKTVFSRWISAANGAAAIDLGERILARYGSAPRECSFQLDAKDRDLWLADFVRLTNRLRVDFEGNPVPVNMQVYEAQESVAGTTFTYKAQEYIESQTDGDAVQDPDVRNIVISASLLNVNLRTLHDSLYVAPTGAETVNVIVRSGVFIGGYAADDRENILYAQRDTTNDFYASGTGTVSGFASGTVPILQRRGIGSIRTTNAGAAYPGGGGSADFKVVEYPISTALDTGTWPVGVTLNMIVEGGAIVRGEGGNGSTHGLSGVVDTYSFESGFSEARGAIYGAVSGGDGGNGMLVRYPITITNGGVISSGGGGGTCALTRFEVPASDPPQDSFNVIPGGGGGGFEVSDTSNVLAGPGPLDTGTRRKPASGSVTTGGTGGYLRISSFVPTLAAIEQRATGGRGGNQAQNGQPASVLLLYGFQGAQTDTMSLSSGGVAGDAIAEGRNLITWINKGDVRGAENI